MSENDSIRSCKKCGKEFIPTPSNVKNGFGFYCSRKCGGTHFTVPLKERFQSRIRKKNEFGCLHWVGFVNPKTGYGTSTDRTRQVSPIGVHRLAWEFANGPIPDGMHVLHKCDVYYAPDDITYRRCVNPEHLFLGTNDDNIADKVAKGRNRRGENLYNAKANDEIVREIRSSYATGIWTAKALGSKFGLSESVIFSIIHRRSWKHVKD